jgi:hypothetical protein
VQVAVTVLVIVATDGTDSNLPPDVAEAHGSSDAGQEEGGPVAPGLAVMRFTHVRYLLFVLH